MRSASFAFAFGALLWLVASAAQAIGFGSTSNATQLGQALNFAASVRLEPDESLARECVAAQVQSGDSRLAPSLVRVSVEAGSLAGERLVRVTTATQIEEPVVSIDLSIGCTSRLARKFVVFIDPPLSNVAQAPSGSLVVPTTPQRIDSAVSPILAALPAARSAAPAPAAPRVAATPLAAARTSRIAASGTRPAAGPGAKDRKSARAARPAAARTTVAGTAPNSPRLKLDSTAELAAVQPVAASTRLDGATLAAAATVLSAPAATGSAASAPLQAPPPQAPLPPSADAQRLQALEDSLATLRRQNEATERTLLDVQARLSKAEAAARPNAPVLAYGLALLCLVLALGWLLTWRRRRAERDARWWAESALARPSVLPQAAASDAGADVDTGAAPVILSAPADIEPVRRTEATAAQKPPAHATSILAVRAPAVPERELSVEELIDLEQQAEFFIVLGQDEDAIDLLNRHVHATGGSSPMPYLKLLEIHRRRGEQSEYEAIRERFEHHFNAPAPQWQADPHPGRPLEAHPTVMAQLQALWPTPARAMQALDATLFRRDAAAETFDLPAYGEILFLYSIARDLNEHPESAKVTDVDLLLPLADEPASPSIARLAATGGQPVAPASVTASLSSSIPLDLDLDSLLPEPDEEIDPFLETGFREVTRPVIGKPKRGLH